mmetsp:Transcript_125357/g.250216  ORF Transcript_125357/g.250216 Transcript_125357/m.250216 type:complete len:127 (+) Transcript_125357:47-427(+)
MSALACREGVVAKRTRNEWQETCASILAADRSIEVWCPAQVGEAYARLQRRYHHGPGHARPGLSGRVYPSRGDDAPHHQSCPAYRGAPPLPPLPPLPGGKAAVTREHSLPREAQVHMNKVGRRIVR